MVTYRWSFRHLSHLGPIGHCYFTPACVDFCLKPLVTSPQSDILPSATNQDGLVCSISAMAHRQLDGRKIAPLPRGMPGPISA
jgi:hypothetical protein